MSVFKLVGDIKFFYLAKSADTLGPADIAVEGAVLLRDPTFETSILISLFSDARADNNDTLPGTFIFRRGWFGSIVLGFTFGSKLWLLGRSKLDETTFRLAEQYAKDALAWMIQDGIAESVEAFASKGGNRQLDFTVIVNRKNTSNTFFRFYVNWEYQTIGGLA